MKRLVLLAFPLLLAACTMPPPSPSGSRGFSEVGDAQQRLRTLGFYQGPVDGIWGPETQMAVERYQRNRGLITTAQLDTPTVSALRTEPRPVARSDEVREAQQRLHTLGFYEGPINGEPTAETQTAIERFQRSRGMSTTARLDSHTLNALRSDESARQAEEARRRAALAQPVAVTEATDVRTIQNRLRQLNFYDGPADGVWGQGTQQAIEGFQRAKGMPVGQMTAQTLSAMGLDPNSFAASRPTAPASNTASAALIARPLDPAVVRGVQQRLRQQGFSAGVPDGVWGPRTRTALVRFQRSRGLEATGQLDPSTATALGMDPNNLAATAVMGR